MQFGRETHPLLQNATYPILNKVKVGAPSASTFKKEIDKLGRQYPEIRTILPLFTNLGVLSKLQLVAFSKCLDCLDGGEEMVDRIDSAIDFLVEKGYLAHFIAGGDTDLYCLSGYSLSCLQKESIRQSQNLFSLSVGNVKLYANTEIHIGDALRFHLCNNVLMAYVSIHFRCVQGPVIVFSTSTSLV